MNEREIFIAALNLPDPAERKAFLDRACAGDADARARVEALLAANEGLGSFLEQPAAPQATGAFEPTADPTPVAAMEETAGSSIGPYKLLEVIGEGGMGTVWMAQQNEPIRRRVAVKVVKPGMDSKQVLARFEAERQALALMDHPNIAKVLDAGTTPSGRPYFVMELVRGIPLTRFCDERHLGVAERLRVFQQVCHAVQHAHQKGVIHRDLKPGNVLVESHDGRPVPKVIDFGLAKAVGAASLTDRSLFTNFGAILGTPLYMAPEQADFGALDVDTRADVYALGVLLYELLTGTTPLEKKRLAAAAWDEIRRVIKEEEPPSPSARLSSSEGRASVAALRQTEPAKLAAFVRSDLDWVVMKALAKERDRRYESASAFAADVERFLNHEPVAAGPPTASYRLRKFVRRNKGAMAVAGLVLFFLVLIGVGAGWAVRDRSAREAEVARDRAARQAATEQEATLAFNEAEGLLRQGRYADALSAARRGEGILAGSGHEAHLRRARDLQKDAHMALRLDGMHMTGQGDRGAADRAAKYAQAFREYGIDADALETEEVARRVAARVIRAELVVGLDTWAAERKESGDASKTSWRLLFAAARAADPDELRNRVRDALTQGKVEVLKGLAASPEIGKLPVQTLDLLGTALYRSGVNDPAFFRAVQRQHPGNFSINFKLGYLLEHREHPQREEALRFYTAALACRPQNAYVRVYVSRILRETGHVEEGIELLRQAVEIDPTFAQAFHHLGVALAAHGRPGEAIAYLRKAVEFVPKSGLYHYSVGDALSKQGKHGEAIPWYGKACELDPNNASLHSHCGCDLTKQGKLAEAVVSFSKAYALAQNHPVIRSNLVKALNALYRRSPTADADLADVLATQGNPKEASAALCSLGDIWKEQNKPEKAIASYQKAIESAPDDFRARFSLANLLEQQDQLDAAVACLMKGLEIDPKHMNCHVALGGISRRQNKPDEAIAWYRKASDLEPTHASLHFDVGRILHKMGALDEAAAFCKKAIASFEESVARNPNSAMDHNNLAWILATFPDARLRDPARAVALAKRALQLDPNHRFFPSTLGAAYYRMGRWRATIVEMERSMAGRPKGEDYGEEYYLAMAHWQLGEKEKARACYDRALEGMLKNQPNNMELRAMQAEAAGLLGLAKLLPYPRPVKD